MRLFAGWFGYGFGDGRRVCHGWLSERGCEGCWLNMVAWRFMAVLCIRGQEGTGWKSPRSGVGGGSWWLSSRQGPGWIVMVVAGSYRKVNKDKKK